MNEAETDTLLTNIERTVDELEPLSRQLNAFCQELERNRLTIATNVSPEALGKFTERIESLLIRILSIMRP